MRLNKPIHKRSRLGNNQFGSDGRGWRAHVGHEVGDSEVRLVPDCRDDRHARSGDGPSHDLFVEGPQILKRAAATARDDDLRPFARTKVANPLGDLDRGTLALDQGRIEPDVQPWMPPLQDTQHVRNGRPSRRRYDADAPRKRWQLPLALLVEEPFRLKLGLEALEALLQRPGPARLQPVDVELVGPTPLEHPDSPAGDDC